MTNYVFTNETFLERVRLLSKIVMGYRSEPDDSITTLVNRDLGDICIEFISKWLFIPEKVVDSALPIFDKFNCLEDFVNKFIENLKDKYNNRNNIIISEEPVVKKKIRKINRKQEMKTHHTDSHNIGEHDLDNSFWLANGGIKGEYDFWLKDHDDCIPIGFCDEVYKDRCGERHIAFVYEEPNGNRYFVHVPSEWKTLKEIFND